MPGTRLDVGQTQRQHVPCSSEAQSSVGERQAGRKKLHKNRKVLCWGRTKEGVLGHTGYTLQYSYRFQCEWLWGWRPLELCSERPGQLYVVIDQHTNYSFVLRAHQCNNNVDACCLGNYTEESLHFTLKCPEVLLYIFAAHLCLLFVSTWRGR